MGWLSSILGIVSNLLGLAKGVQDAKNAPEIKQNKNAEVHSNEADKVNKEIEEAHGKNPQKAQDEIRKDFAEN